MDELQERIDKEKRLKKHLLYHGVSEFMVKSLYNVRAIRYEEKVYVVGAQHWTWDFCVGVGNNLKEASKEIKPVINMYNSKYPARKDCEPETIVSQLKELGIIK